MALIICHLPNSVKRHLPNCPKQVPQCILPGMSPRANARSKDPIRSPMGQRVESLRIERGLKVAELAKRAGMHYHALYSFLGRDNARTNGEALARIAAALETSPEYLATGDGPRDMRPESVDAQLQAELAVATEDEKAELLALLRWHHRPRDAEKSAP